MIISDVKEEGVNSGNLSWLKDVFWEARDVKPVECSCMGL